MALSLEDCVRLAENAPSSVTAARLQSEAAGLLVKGAKAGFFPRLQLSNGFVYNSPLQGSILRPQSFISLDAVHAYNTVISTQLELDTSGRLRAQVSRTEADQELASAQLQIAARDLRRLVAGAYYQLLMARHLVEVAEASLNEARNFEQLTRQLFEQGEVARSDLVQASAERALREQGLEASRLDEQLADHALVSFWTTQIDQTVALQDVLEDKPPLPPSDVLQPGQAVDSILQRPEFNALDAQLQGFQADARIAKAELFPQATMVFQYGLDSDQWTMHDRGYALYLYLDIPLFDWFKASKLSQAATLNSQRIETEKAIATRTLTKEYGDAAARVRDFYSQISLAESRLTLSAEHLRLSRLRYEGGEGSALDTINAQSRWSEARGNYFMTLAAYWNALVELEVAKGR